MLPITLLSKVLQWLFYTGFVHMADKKKVVAGRVRQVGVIYSNNCMGIGLGKL